MDDLSVCAYTCIGLCVSLSSALWKNGGSDPDAVWHRRSDGSRDEAGFGDRSTVRGTFGANLGHAIVTDWDFTAYMCECRDAALFPNYFGQTCYYEDQRFQDQGQDH